MPSRLLLNQPGMFDDRLMSADPLHEVRESDNEMERFEEVASVGLLRRRNAAREHRGERDWRKAR